MEKSEALPQFFEDKHIQSKPVHLARFSKDGKLLAIVHTDLSLSIWDSQDILVNTFEQSFYESRSKNRSNSHHIVFLDWSATNKYIYLIIDCTGYQIDVYSKTKKPYNFTFDQPLNSFSTHPYFDNYCIVTCLDNLIELNINENQHSKLLDYHEEAKVDSSKKTSIISYAEYTGLDDTIILWLQTRLRLIRRNGTTISSIQLKNSQPLQQRIRIIPFEKRCIIAFRNEITVYSLPDFEVELTYRDTVNDSIWKVIDYCPQDQFIVALPEHYVSEGPVFYLIPLQGEMDNQIYREPQKKFCWCILHPSGNTILFCDDDDDGDIVLFRREKKEFTWNGPMYPYHYTYLKKNEVADKEMDQDFEQTYFPVNDRGIDLSQCKQTHPIDICVDAPKPPALLSIDLQLNEEEYIVMKNVNQLPQPIEDIYGH